MEGSECYGTSGLIHPPSITAGQLLLSISTEPSVIITGIGFASQSNGSVERCRTLAILTLDCHFTSSWVYRNELIGNANWLTGKVGSSVVCLSMMELVNFLLQYERVVPSSGFAPQDLTSVLTTSIRTLDTGFEEMLYSMTQSSGENTSIEVLFTASGLSALLQFLRTCLNSWRSPEALASKLISDRSHTMILHHGSGTMSFPPDSMAYHGSQIYGLLKTLSSKTSSNGRLTDDTA